MDDLPHKKEVTSRALGMIGYRPGGHQSLPIITYASYEFLFLCEFDLGRQRPISLRSPLEQTKKRNAEILI